MNDREKKQKELEEDVREYEDCCPSKFKSMVEGYPSPTEDEIQCLKLEVLAEEVIRQLELRFKNRSPLYKVQKLKNWELRLLVMAYDALERPLPEEYKQFIKNN